MRVREVERRRSARPASARQVFMILGLVALLVGGGLLIKRAFERQPPPPQATPHAGLEVPVTAMDRTVGLANNSPLLLADPTDPRFVVLANRQDAPDFSCGLQVSGDGGRGWAPANPVPVLPPGAEKCYAPEVAFDRHGRLYYLFVGLAGRGNEPMGVFLSTSEDRARTFSPPHQVLGPLNFAVRMALDPTVGPAGRIHLVWLHATSDPPLGGFGPPPNPILAAHSDDGGRTFSEPVQVNDPERERVVAPALELGPDRAVHVAYYDLGQDVVDYQGLEGPVWEGNWTLVAVRSLDGGQSFGRGVVVDDGIAPPERVMLIFTMAPPALVSHRDRLCLAWTDARHGDPDALLRCSDDQGRSWTAPIRLNDDPIGNGISQYQPRLSVAPDGRLDAIFYDRRIVPGNFANDVFYTFSTDGGRQFAPNIRLSRDGSDSRIGPQYANPSAQGQFEFGSRLGLLSRRDDALAAWTDTRNSLQMSTGQDVFLTSVELSGSPAAAGQAPESSSSPSPRPWSALWRAAVEWLRGEQPPSAAGAGPPLPGAAPVVQVTMRDFRYDYQPPAHAGRVVFRFINAGEVAHWPELFSLPEDMPPIDVQLRGSERRVIAPFAGVYPRGPGNTGTFAVNLVPGTRYAIICLAQGEGGISHARKWGMTAEFRAGAPPGGVAGGSLP